MSAEDFEVFSLIRAERKATKAARRRAWEQRLAAMPRHRWRRCSETHYQCHLLGDLLDFWPGTQRFRWRGKSMHGDVLEFIAARLREARREQ